MNPKGTPEKYCLTLFKNNRSLELALSSFDSLHAQAQAADITRALQAHSFSLSYKKVKESCVSELFKKLALNDFSTKECTLWEGKYTNNVPCAYVLGERVYVKNIILSYLDIPKEDYVTKSTCNEKTCINPYHFTHVHGTNTKLTCGDLKLAVAYRSQGTSVRKVAEALNVHPSTLYRRLKNECFSLGTPSKR